MKLKPLEILIALAALGLIALIFLKGDEIVSHRQVDPSLKVEAK